MPAADITRFVLIGTSHPGNVGAAARAMKVMGFTDLVLVAPRFADVLQQPEAVAMAGGATSTRSEKPITFIARAAAPTLPGWLVPIRMKRVGSVVSGTEAGA